MFWLRHHLILSIYLNLILRKKNALVNNQTRGLAQSAAEAEPANQGEVANSSEAAALAVIKRLAI